MTHAELKDIMDNESINELMAGETVYLEIFIEYDFSVSLNIFLGTDGKYWLWVEDTRDDTCDERFYETYEEAYKNYHAAVTSAA